MWECGWQPRVGCEGQGEWRRWLLRMAAVVTGAWLARGRVGPRDQYPEDCGSHVSRGQRREL